jgi:hypothetical protein
MDYSVCVSQPRSFGEIRLCFVEIIGTYSQPCKKKSLTKRINIFGFIKLDWSKVRVITQAA